MKKIILFLIVTFVFWLNTFANNYFPQWNPICLVSGTNPNGGTLCSWLEYSNNKDNTILFNGLSLHWNLITPWYNPVSYVLKLNKNQIKNLNWIVYVSVENYKNPYPSLFKLVPWIIFIKQNDNPLLSLNQISLIDSVFLDKNNSSLNSTNTYLKVNNNSWDFQFWIDLEKVKKYNEENMTGIDFSKEFEIHFSLSLLAIDKSVCDGVNKDKLFETCKSYGYEEVLSWTPAANGDIYTYEITSYLKKDTGLEESVAIVSGASWNKDGKTGKELPSGFVDYYNWFEKNPEYVWKSWFRKWFVSETNTDDPTIRWQTLYPAPPFRGCSSQNWCWKVDRVRFNMTFIPWTSSIRLMDYDMDTNTLQGASRTSELNKETPERRVWNPPTDSSAAIKFKIWEDAQWNSLFSWDLIIINSDENSNCQSLKSTKNPSTDSFYDNNIDKTCTGEFKWPVLYLQGLSWNQETALYKINIQKYLDALKIAEPETYNKIMQYTEVNPNGTLAKNLVIRLVYKNVNFWAWFGQYPNFIALASNWHIWEFESPEIVDNSYKFSLNTELLNTNKHILWYWLSWFDFVNQQQYNVINPPKTPIISDWNDYQYFAFKVANDNLIRNTYQENSESELKEINPIIRDLKFATSTELINNLKFQKFSESEISTIKSWTFSDSVKPENVSLKPEEASTITKKGVVYHKKCYYDWSAWNQTEIVRGKNSYIPPQLICYYVNNTYNSDSSFINKKENREIYTSNLSSSGSVKTLDYAIVYLKVAKNNSSETSDISFANNPSNLYALTDSATNSFSKLNQENVSSISVKSYIEGKINTLKNLLSKRFEKVSTKSFNWINWNKLNSKNSNPWSSNPYSKLYQLWWYFSFDIRFYEKDTTWTKWVDYCRNWWDGHANWKLNCSDLNPDSSFRNGTTPIWFDSTSSNYLINDQYINILNNSDALPPPTPWMEVSWDLDNMSISDKDYLYPDWTKKATNTTKIETPFYIINTGTEPICNIRVKPVIPVKNSLISDPNSSNNSSESLFFNTNHLNWISITDSDTPLNLGDKLDVTSNLASNKKTKFKVIPLNISNSISLEAKWNLCDNPSTEVNFISKKLIFNFNEEEKRIIADWQVVCDLDKTDPSLNTSVTIWSKINYKITCKNPWTSDVNDLQIKLDTDPNRMIFNYWLWLWWVTIWTISAGETIDYNSPNLVQLMSNYSIVSEKNSDGDIIPVKLSWKYSPKQDWNLITPIEINWQHRVVSNRDNIVVTTKLWPCTWLESTWYPKVTTNNCSAYSPDSNVYTPLSNPDNFMCVTVKYNRIKKDDQVSYLPYYKDSYLETYKNQYGDYTSSNINRDSPLTYSENTRGSEKHENSRAWWQCASADSQNGTEWRVRGKYYNVKVSYNISLPNNLAFEDSVNKLHSTSYSSVNHIISTDSNLNTQTKNIVTTLNDLRGDSESDISNSPFQRAVIDWDSNFNNYLSSVSFTVKIKDKSEGTWTWQKIQVSANLSTDKKSWYQGDTSMCYENWQCYYRHDTENGSHKHYSSYYKSRAPNGSVANCSWWDWIQDRYQTWEFNQVSWDLSVPWSPINKNLWSPDPTYKNLTICEWNEDKAWWTQFLNGAVYWNKIDFSNSSHSVRDSSNNSQYDYNWFLTSEVWSPIGLVSKNTSNNTNNVKYTWVDPKKCLYNWESYNPSYYWTLELWQVYEPRNWKCLDGSYPWFDSIIKGSYWRVNNFNKLWDSALDRWWMTNFNLNDNSSLGWDNSPDKIWYYNNTDFANRAFIIWNRTWSWVEFSWRGTLFIKGDLNIKSDVVYKQLLGSINYKTELDKVYGLGIIVDGNVYIDPSVKEVNALMFVNWTIHTGEWNEQLVMKGAFIANEFVLERYPTVNSSADPISWNMSPSQRFFYDSRFDLVVPPWFKLREGYKQLQTVAPWDIQKDENNN